MSQSQPIYPDPGYPNQEQSPQPPAEQYGGSPQPGQDGAQDNAPASGAAGRRKRHYAGQAYDFGAGANSGLGGQHQGGGSFSGPLPAGYGGYNSQDPQQQVPPQPSYNTGYGTSQPVGNPAYGQPPPAVGGYQAPDPTYPTTSMAGGVAGITQGMGNMGVAGQSVQAGQPMQQRPLLNQLYPVDLLNQPFHVAELDLPPPPINLPPNVSTEGDASSMTLTLSSQA